MSYNNVYHNTPPCIIDGQEYRLEDYIAFNKINETTSFVTLKIPPNTFKPPSGITFPSLKDIGLVFTAIGTNIVSIEETQNTDFSVLLKYEQETYQYVVSADLDRAIPIWFLMNLTRWVDRMQRGQGWCRLNEVEVKCRRTRSTFKHPVAYALPRYCNMPTPETYHNYQPYFELNPISRGDVPTARLISQILNHQAAHEDAVGHSLALVDKTIELLNESDIDSAHYTLIKDNLNNIKLLLGVDE